MFGCSLNEEESDVTDTSIKDDFAEIKGMLEWHWSTKYTHKVEVITRHHSQITILLKTIPFENANKYKT